MLKQTLEIIQSVATILALAVGAAWGLHIYNEQREAHPQLNLDHNVHSFQLNEDYQMLHVAVAHENRGKTLIRLRGGDIRIQQVLPLSSTMAESLAQGTPLVPDGESTVPWPMLCRRVSEQAFELEPNETHEAVNDFIIPSYVTTVKVYTYYAHAQKYGIGWTNATFHNLMKEGTHDEIRASEHSGIRHICDRDAGPIPE